MIILHYIYPFICRWIFELFQLFTIVYNVPMNTGTIIVIYIYIYILVIKSRIVSGFFSDSTCKPKAFSLFLPRLTSTLSNLHAVGNQTF